MLLAFLPGTIVIAWKATPEAARRFRRRE